MPAEKLAALLQADIPPLLAFVKHLAHAHGDLRRPQIGDRDRRQHRIANTAHTDPPPKAAIDLHTGKYPIPQYYTRPVWSDRISFDKLRKCETIIHKWRQMAAAIFNLLLAIGAASHAASAAESALHPLCVEVTMLGLR